MATPSAPPEIVSHDSGYKVTLGTPPPRRAGEKSLVEILVVPIALTVATAIAGHFANEINRTAQKAASDRAERAAQISAVAEISAGPGENPSIPLFVARLALYEEHAVPILIALLQDEESEQRLSPEQRNVVERNLIQIALQGHQEAVGRPMLAVLEDPWKLYGFRTHRSALRILSILCYPGMADAVAASRYDPRERMKEGDWERLLSNSEDQQGFDEALARARQLAGSCAAKPEKEPQWALSLGRR